MTQDTIEMILRKIIWSDDDFISFCFPCLCSVHIISKKKMIMCCLQRYWQEGSLSKSLFFQIFCIFQPRDSKEEENNVLFAEGIDRKSGEHRSHFSVTVSLDFNFCIWKISEIFTLLCCIICIVFYNWTLSWLLLISCSVKRIHCQRHNRPEGWVHVTKVTS